MENDVVDVTQGRIKLVQISRRECAPARVPEGENDILEVEKVLQEQYAVVQEELPGGAGVVINLPPRLALLARGQAR